MVENVSTGVGLAQARYYMDIDASGWSAEQILQGMQSGPGTQSMNISGEITRSHVKLHEEIRDLVHRIAGKIESGWEGEGAEAAKGALRPFRLSAEQCVDSLNQAKSIYESQSDSFTNAYNGMPDLPAGGRPETGMYDTVTPWDTDTEKAVHDYDAKSQEIISRYQSYADSSVANANSMPQSYPHFGEFSGDMRMAAPDSGRAVTGFATPPQVDGGGTTSAAGFSGGGSAGGSVSNVATPPSGGAGGGGAGGIGGGNAAQPGPVTGTRTPGSFTGSGQPAGARIGAPFGPGGSGLTGMRGGGMGMPMMGAVGAGGMGGGDTPRGGRAFGGGVRGGPGGSSAAPRVTGSAPGGRTGAMPGGAAAAEASAARGTSGAGGRSVAGAPMGGAGKGKGGEDEEHQRASFLVEPDAEGTFGTGEMTAPPVIGEDPQ